MILYAQCTRGETLAKEKWMSLFRSDKVFYTSTADVSAEDPPSLFWKKGMLSQVLSEFKSICIQILIQHP